MTSIPSSQVEHFVQLSGLSPTPTLMAMSAAYRDGAPTEERCTAERVRLDFYSGGHGTSIHRGMKFTHNLVPAYEGMPGDYAICISKGIEDLTWVFHKRGEGPPPPNSSDTFIGLRHWSLYFRSGYAGGVHKAVKGVLEERNGGETQLNFQYFIHLPEGYSSLLLSRLTLPGLRGGAQAIAEGISRALGLANPSFVEQVDRRGESIFRLPTDVGALELYVGSDHPLTLSLSYRADTLPDLSSQAVGALRTFEKAMLGICNVQP